MKNSDSVMEFLAGIPMLQRLPISTLKRIAEVADVAKFGAGEYVIRKGEGADGLYFIKEGEVVVSGQSDAEKGLERHLKANDCFGSCLLYPSCQHFYFYKCPSKKLKLYELSWLNQSIKTFDISSPFPPRLSAE